MSQTLLALCAEARGRGAVTDGRSDPHTRLCLKPSLQCVLKHEAVELWLKAGVTSNKLVLGVAAYGRTQKMTSADLHAPGDPADTALPTVNGPLTRSPGTYTNFEVTLHSILHVRTSDIVIIQSTLSAS